MKRVFASQDQAAIAIVRELLANEGIETTIQNENMSAVSGEVPFTLAMPEICVVRDEDEAQALAIAEGDLVMANPREAKVFVEDYSI